jgi:hypothetical protein
MSSFQSSGCSAMKVAMSSTHPELWNEDIGE